VARLEPDQLTRATAAEANASKKRKAAEPAGKPGPTKKVALSTGAGSSPTPRTAKPSNGVKTIPGAKQPSATSTSNATAAAVVKDVKADASFFSAKPKPKLPSFRRIQKPVEPAPIQASTASVSGVAQPMDWDPFADALKSVRKGSPNVKSQSQPGTNSMDVDLRVDGKEPSTSGSGPAAISAKTGKPKKVVRFAGEGELEKIQWIARAVYEDDGSVSGPYGVHGRSLADLQREEGSLLRHKMLEQVDWVTPSLIANKEAKERGLESTEKDVQAQREASTLAALYQGAPPDTPVEPLSLATLPMDITDPNVVVMMPGEDVAAMMQSTSMTTSLQDLMAQLTGGTLSTIPTTTATTPAPAPAPAPAPTPAPEAGVGGNLAELLERLKGTLPSNAPAADLYGGGSSFSATPTGPAGYESTNGYGTGAGGYGGTQPPTGPAHDSYSGGGNSLGTYSSGHGSAYGDSGRGRGGGQPARGRGNRGVPASQNTRRPLCSFFAKGRLVPPRSLSLFRFPPPRWLMSSYVHTHRCRYGEDCDFSHDPSKLAGR
jgi:protein phosphatase 1 regulatory subunit 10